MTEPIEPAKHKRQQSALQIGLRHLLLATIAVAIWTAHYINTYTIASQTTKLARLQKVSQDLVINDPSRIATVSRDDDLDSPFHWSIYIPNDDYEILFTTRNIDSGKHPTQILSHPLTPGRFELLIRQTEQENGFAIVVTRNEQELFRVNETKDWRSSFSHFSSGLPKYSQQHDGKSPIDIIRLRFNIPVPGSPNATTSPNGPSNGMLLQIQKRS